ncbi:MAG: FtsB family cell division protein [Marmoricola sp.]
MAVLLVVVALLVVSYASSMHAWLRQQSTISDLQAQIASSQQHIHALKQEKGRWHDKAYVEEQARRRFGWVMPGDVAYQVIGPDGKPLPGERHLSGTGPQLQTTSRPWWSRAYGSLERADHPAKYHKQPPASRITPPGRHHHHRRGR